MSRKFASISIAVFLLVEILFLTPAVWASAQLFAFSNYQLVNSKRISATVWEYSYTVDITNLTPQTASPIVGTVRSFRPTAVVTADTVHWGSVAPGVTATSSDAFTVQIDRRFPLNPSDLSLSARGTFCTVADCESVPMLEQVVGSSDVRIPRADSCGRGDGRLCESLIGDVVTDAMRHTYNLDVAITNSGGLRADLTCPYPDVMGDYCPAYTPPPYLITRGSVWMVMPFGNWVVTLQVNGAELKAMLENGVSFMPSAQGRYPQISGLCFTYDISLPPGTRVTGAVHQAADASCTGPPFDLTAGATYQVGENDFMVQGGDGYPNFDVRATLRGVQYQAVADYIMMHPALTPKLQGRITCTSSGPTACPLVQ